MPDAPRSTAPAPPTGARRLLALASGAGATSLAEHRAHYAVPPMPHTRAEALITLVERAGLTGRGGAGFPTAKKLRAVAARRRASVVVANGTEGEPLSGKDALLLRLQPHLVLDGAALAAAAVGATDIHVCIDREQQHAIACVTHAVAERLHGDPPGVAISVLAAPSRYVAGEETALVHWINGGDAKPTRTPPRPFERGVGGRPTLVDNVETLAHLTQIAAYGDAWFRGLGTTSEPGTALLSLSGAVTKPAVYEAPIGLRLATLIDGAAPLHGVGAVLVGGYFGSWLDPRTAATVRLCNDELRPIGGGLGCGAIAVLPADACGVTESARILQWMAGETAGQCGPCVHGLAAIAQTFDKLARGGARPAEIQTLHRWAGQVDGRGACRFPDGAIRFLRSALVVFGDDLERHALGRPCRGANSAPLLPVPVSRKVWR